MTLLRKIEWWVTVLAVVVAVWAGGVGAQAQGGVETARSGSEMQTIKGLGTTAFATSTKSAAAQNAFLRGLLLLHLFEYSDSAKAFVAAEKADPGFAMAYWGEAMTFNHGVWNEVDVAAGRAALAKFGATAEARAGRVADAREKAYLGAVELLYDGTGAAGGGGGEGAGAKAERDRRYAKAMGELSERFAQDRNAKLFYALALLGQSEGVRDVPVYLRAAAIAEGIFRMEPNNPGAAHYWIHGMDDPGHAAGALEAARALSKIAPDAPHAQHMCSHIFMALGMWDDVVAANVEAVRVGGEMDRAQGYPARACGHYPNWLEYGYFQQGRRGLAEATVAACQRSEVDGAAWIVAHPGAGLYGARDSGRVQARVANGVAFMESMAEVEGQEWKVVARCDGAGLTPDGVAWCEFANGLGAAERGDVAAARVSLGAMRAKTEMFAGGKGVDPEDLKALRVGLDELGGLIEVKDGHGEAGVTMLRAAVASYESMAFAFGPPVTVKPPEELLGEVLLEKGDAAGARRAFEQSLERAPRRALSLLGRARAERMGGDAVSGRRDFETLATMWKDADAQTPGLAEVRRAVAEPVAGAGR